MPYYIYRVTQLGPVKQLDKLTQFDKFKDAKDLCRELRQAQAADGGKDQIRMTFAKDEQEARRLLGNRRAPAYPLEEWEA